jgi:hypothetical protein
MTVKVASVVSLSTLFVVNTPSRFHDLIMLIWRKFIVVEFICDSMDASIIDELLVGLNPRGCVGKE